MAPTKTDAPAAPLRLTYFQGRGLAEIARLMLHAAGVPFEDVRVEKIEQVGDLNKLPFRQIPILEAKGHVIAQSNAINRYIAREYGLYGSTSEEAAKIDMVCEAVADIRQQHGALAKVAEDKREAEKEKFAATVLPRNINGLERILVSNDGGNGFFVGKKISLADVTMQNFVFNFKPLYPTMLENAPKIEGHYARVSAYPGIAEWIKNRPVSNF